VANLIHELYQPLVHPITASNFTNRDGVTYYVTGKPRLTTTMGKKIVIITADSRPRDKTGEVLHKGPLDYESMAESTPGALGHYLFGTSFHIVFGNSVLSSISALIHGYDYRYVQSPEFADKRWGTWTKVPVVKEALKTHEVAVFLDIDIGFHYPHVPLEWLMNHWGVTNKTLVAMALDVDEATNFNDEGELSLNTGFLIAQQSPRTQEMFDSWLECPQEPESSYYGCNQWFHEWAHEQAAFRDYIRPKFNRSEEIVTIPCNEANGSPEGPGKGATNCTGTFARHYWHHKNLVKRELTDGIMPYIVSRLHEQLHKDPRNIQYAGDKKLLDGWTFH
jgi:hypothetical protein